MTEYDYSQLFWFIFSVTVFTGFLVFGGLLFSLYERVSYRRFLKHQKAKSAWAKIISSKSN